MAGAGYKNWSAGDIPTAVEFDTLLQEQVVQVHPTAAARNTALSVVKAEGMTTFQLDSNSYTVYTGSAWSTLGPVHGAFTSVTPVITQGATPTFTNTHCAYTRFGRLIVGNMSLAVTSAGTASNTIVITGLPACAFGVDTIGSGYILDASVPRVWAVRPYFATGSNIQFHSTTDSNGAALSTFIMGSGANAMTAALASGDVISFNFTYEAAADA